MEPILRWLLVLNVVFLPILVPRGPKNSVPADIPAVLLLVMGTACLLRARQPFHIPLAWSNLLIVGGGLARGRPIDRPVGGAGRRGDRHLSVRLVPRAC